MRYLRALTAVCSLLLIVSAAAGAAPARDSAPLKGEGEGLKIVANIPYAGGTDMEFATIKGRDYAFAASAPGVGGAEHGALRVIDVTKPERPKLKATLACSLYQGDVQLSHDEKTLILAADSAGGPDSCLAVGKSGFMTIDISNPLKPKPVGFAEIARGSHNTTAHPTKPFVYNSDSDQTNRGNIEIWSIKNPAKPEKVADFATVTHSPHDISFNEDGTRAVTAARTHFDILDTTDPAAPTLLFKGQCPGCYLTHDAKFTPDGSHIILGDEAGGGGSYPCPGGALYFYELQGTEDQPVAVLAGVYEPNELVFARDGQTGPASCTSHVFDISEDSSKLAISWYSAGTRYLDISTSTGVTLGENRAHEGPAELGWFMPDGGVTWSSKFFKGPYIYSNDEFRGFDVFKIQKKG
ncbi:MAG: LVIVD repeat-containing protein [Actinomycetota bacterium]